MVAALKQDSAELYAYNSANSTAKRRKNRLTVSSFVRGTVFVVEGAKGIFVATFDSGQHCNDISCAAFIAIRVLHVSR